MKSLTYKHNQASNTDIYIIIIIIDTIIIKKCGHCNCVKYFKNSHTY
jgi:hypothetical protein